MADTDLRTVHRAFVEAMAKYQDEAVLMQMTVRDLALLVGVLAERVRHRHWHDPIRRGLERILQACVAQLDTCDPVLAQWLKRYNEEFAFQEPREAEP